MASYSNLTALRALVKASLQSIMRSPSAIVFGIAFPLIFILVFGFLSGGGTYSIRLTSLPGSDTTNPLVMGLKQVPTLKWKTYANDNDRAKDLKEGNIAAIIAVDPVRKEAGIKYNITIRAASSQMDKVQQLQGIIRAMLERTDPEIGKKLDALADIHIEQTTVRTSKTIDFILPGQLGFSLLAGSVFGTAFVFFNLRQTLVLKRFFATPVRREIIVLSEGIARMTFQIATAVIIIGIGHYAFDFTLIHGFQTFLSLLLLSALGIMVFMGFGFIVSSIAKSDATIPPFSNLITLPQFLLAGTFFPIEAFPKWLQPISRALPLTYLNDAMRQVAFEGAGFAEIRWDVMALVIWGIVLYFAASRLFKWE